MSRTQILFIVALAIVAGCGDAVVAPSPVAPVVPEDREQKAIALHTLVMSAPVDEKVVLLRRIVGVYGDTKIAPRANFELVFFLMQCHPPEFDAAFVAVKAYSERYPTEPLVSEAFHRVHDVCNGMGRADLVSAVRESWGAWLVAHDAADDIPKEILLPELFTLRVLEQRWSEAKVVADAAVEVPNLPRFRRAELLHRKGDMLVHFLGDPITACTVLRESLGICNDLEALRVPMRHDREGVLASLAHASAKTLSLFVVTASADDETSSK